MKSVNQLTAHVLHLPFAMYTRYVAKTKRSNASLRMEQFPDGTCRLRLQGKIIAEGRLPSIVNFMNELDISPKRMHQIRMRCKLLKRGPK